MSGLFPGLEDRVLVVPLGRAKWSKALARIVGGLGLQRSTGRPSPSSSSPSPICMSMSETMPCIISMLAAWLALVLAAELADQHVRDFPGPAYALDHGVKIFLVTPQGAATDLANAHAPQVPDNGVQRLARIEQAWISSRISRGRRFTVEMATMSAPRTGALNPRHHGPTGDDVGPSPSQGRYTHRADNFQSDQSLLGQPGRVRLHLVTAHGVAVGVQSSMQDGRVQLPPGCLVQEAQEDQAAVLGQQILEAHLSPLRWCSIRSLHRVFDSFQQLILPFQLGE
jgi:hypothetical protein